MNAGFEIVKDKETGHVHLIKRDLNVSTELKEMLGDIAANEVNSALVQFIPGFMDSIAKRNIYAHSENFKTARGHFVMTGYQALALENVTRWEISAITRLLTRGAECL